MPSLLLVLTADNTYRFKGAFRKSYSYAPLTLTVLAALLPDPQDFEIDLVDEGVEHSAQRLRHYDIVGISCVTSAAPRAYELASFWRSKGAHVVLGGSHPTLLPQEAMEQADTVITGAAEHSWPIFIQDFRNNCPKKFYSDPASSNAHSAMPVPRRDLVRHGLYLNIPTVLAQPGCNNHCAFCSIPHLGHAANGARRIHDVVEEIRALRTRRVLFLDPNITANRQYAIKLFKSLIPLRLQWAGLASIDLVRDEELLKVMNDSGCIGLLIGMESLQQANLASARKYFACVEQYSAAIRTLHAAEIVILGCFVLGFDHDTRESLQEMPKLVEELKIDLPRYSILTPFPGTDIFTTLEQENRILTKDWSLYDTEHVVFKPALMDPGELQQALYSAWKYSYQLPVLLKRSLRLNGNRIMGMLANMGLRQYSRKLNKLDKAMNSKTGCISVPKGE